MTTTRIGAGVDDLQALQLLVSVVELGSLSQAAARHGVSQPAASTRLTRIERRIGLQLVQRSTSGCTPTPEGAAIVEWARDLIERAERMSRAIDSLRTTSGASIAASLTIAEQLLPGWLAQLHIRRPDVKVRVQVINSTHVLEAVRDGSVSLGFVETTAPIHGLRRQLVARDRLVVVIPTGHAWSRRRTPLQPHHLADAHLVLREPGSGTRATLENALGAVGLTLAEPALELPSTAAVRNAVAAGVAPSVISELAVKDDIAAGRLHVVDVRGIDLSRPLHAVWHGVEPPLLRLLREP